MAELNDEGVYGFGQFATLLRARYALPSIVSTCKTDCLTFKVSELVAGVARHLGNATLESLVSQARPSPLATR